MSGDANVEAERARLKSRFPTVRTARAAVSFGAIRRTVSRAVIRGFNGWELPRKHAWWCGFNVGLCDRLRVAEEGRGK